MGVLLPLACIAALALTVGWGLPAGAHHVDASEVVYVLPPDRIPAITDPTFTTSDWLGDLHGDAERVLFVSVAGDARAYPLRILNWHEIVNDVVGGVPVAATFCPLCGTGIAYERTLADGTVLEFRVSGRLYKNDLVMYDVQSGPESWWPQILGEAITGPLHGTRLTHVPSSVLPWGEVKERYPHVKLLERPRDASGQFLRDYDVNPYAGYVTSDEVFFGRGHVDTQSGLHPKEFVLAVTVGEATRIYPYRFLSEERVVNDAVGGVGIVVTFSADSGQAFLRGDRTFVQDGAEIVDGTGARYDLLTGRSGADALEPAVSLSGFWFAVYDFEIERAGFADVFRIGLLEPSGSERAPLWDPAVLALLVAIPAAAILLLVIARRRRARGGSNG